MSSSLVPGKDSLYIGGIQCLKKAYLQEIGVTHIISVIKYDFQRYEHLRDYKHLQIEVNDIETENLLQHFEKTGAWIEEAFRSGNNEKPGTVLVHCAMGISRSVTIVTAYLLRERPELKVTSALACIRKTRPQANPNTGFIAQLELYKKMGCPRNIKAHPSYRMWESELQMKRASNTGEAPAHISFLDEHEDRDEQPSPRIREKFEEKMKLTCRKCRKTLAISAYLIQHTPKVSPAIGNVKTENQIQHNGTTCTSHFIHPLSWMRPILESGQLSGRLECPNKKCASIIGRYSWHGQRCSCGTWVCPSFSLQKSRCDEIDLSKQLCNLNGRDQNIPSAV